MTARARVRTAAVRSIRWVSSIPLGSRHRVSAEAADYWTSERDDRWRSDSHWREATAYDDDAWLGMGAEHLRLYRRLACIPEGTRWRHAVDWGSGGGANAVHFAPWCDEFTAVDLSMDTVEECARQVEQATDTPVRTVVLDPENPERALRSLGGPCDLFVCLYVLELVPSPEYGLRVMRIAHSALAPGGSAFVQIKYQTRSWQTRPARFAYRRNLANMTTYRVEEFWASMLEIGFHPRSVHLVPSNELDERYAYFVLDKP